MKKIALITVFSFIAVVFDFSFGGLLGAKYFLSGLVPLIFFLAILRPFDEAIAFPVVCGLMFDIVSDGNFFFMTVFLLLEALLILQLKRRLISFINPFVIFASLAFLGATKAFANLLIFWWGSFSSFDLLKMIAANVIFAFFVTAIFFVALKFQEKRKHGI